VFRIAVRDQRHLVTAGSVLVSVHQLAEVLVPVTIGAVIDDAVRTGDAGTLGRWLALLVLQFLVLSAAGCTAVYIEERTAAGATHRVRLDVARRILHPAGVRADALPGEVVSLSTVETSRIGEGVGAVILVVGALVGVVAGAAVLLATSWVLGLVVVVGLPVVLLAVQVAATPLVSRADAHQEAVGTAAGVAADLLGGLRILKGLGAEAPASATYRRASGDALDAALDANRFRSSYAGFTLTISGVFVILVAVIGGRQALEGTITVGQLVAAFGVTQFLVGPLGRLAFTGGVFAQSRASAERLARALDAPPAVAGGEGRLAGRPHGALALRGLRAGPLTGVSVEVPAGQHVGVVTTDPAEAAALVACLDRSTDPGSGHVTVDDVDLAGLDPDEARRAVVVAHHDAPLFEGSVAENVGAAAPDGADLAAAVAAAGAESVVAELADGIDAALDEGGRSLSGGQRQRLALARALAADAPVLVLHEPTTAVDAATEHRIATGLRRLRAGRTTLLVTTSPALLATTDRVVVLEGGRVVADGDHAGLAATDAAYRSVVLT
jgi:putative ABC transport system ATP-binding protein